MSVFLCFFLFSLYITSYISLPLNRSDRRGRLLWLLDCIIRNSQFLFLYFYIDRDLIIYIYIYILLQCCQSPCLCKCEALTSPPVLFTFLLQSCAFVAFMLPPLLCSWLRQVNIPLHRKYLIRGWLVFVLFKRPAWPTVFCKLWQNTGYVSTMFHPTQQLMKNWTQEVNMEMV